jgi:hypothetical protein
MNKAETLFTWCKKKHTVNQPVTCRWYYNEKQNIPLSEQFQNIPLSEQFQNTIENRRNRGEIDSLNTHIYDHSLFWLGTGTSIKRGWTKLD